MQTFEHTRARVAAVKGAVRAGNAGNELHAGEVLGSEAGLVAALADAVDVDGHCGGESRGCDETGSGCPTSGTQQRPPF